MLPPQPCSALLPLSTVQRLVACVLPVRIRIRSLLQLEREHWASVGSHGTFPATSVARAASFGSSASYVSATIEPNPRDSMLPGDTKPQWGSVPQWDAIPQWDAVLLRDAVSQQDTLPCGITCRDCTKCLSQSAMHFNVGAQDVSTPCSYGLYPVCLCHSTQSVQPCSPSASRALDEGPCPRWCTCSRRRGRSRLRVLLPAGVAPTRIKCV